VRKCEEDEEREREKGRQGQGITTIHTHVPLA
jgi:hypothetical protein